MAIWLLARAAGAPLPRRLVYVVDRQAVVDQATEFAGQLRERLEGDERLGPVRSALGIGRKRLPISTLRGRHADNREWMADPAAPAIVVGTVDMVGSRLLFEGYGLSRRMRPFAAGLLGCDILAVLDEAHLARPFERLLKTIEKERRRPSEKGADAQAGAFAGPSVRDGLPPPLRVLPLSATLGPESDGNLFRLNDDDRKNGTVRTRLKASKTLTVEDLESGSSLDRALACRAWKLMEDACANAGQPPAVAVYCDRRADAEKVADNLCKRAAGERPGPHVILLVGGRRVRERQEAAEELQEYGLVSESRTPRPAPVFFVATSAGEVGVDLDADHMVCDLVAWERMVQRLGRVNRRGAGNARVVVIDQGKPDEKKKAGALAAARHEAVRSLLDALPQDEAGEHQAGPGALESLAADPARCAPVAEATTPMPLYPSLTRPLVDAWAMTALDDHAGRPEVGPWLRGWVEEDEPQTAVIWRHYLPLSFGADSGDAKAQPERTVRAFFAAAPPQTAELLEIETSRVVDWLKKRACKQLKELDKAVVQAVEPSPAPVSDSVNDGEEAAGGKRLLAPLTRGAPIAFLLDAANRPAGTLSLAEVDKSESKNLKALLAGKRLVVDARLGGIKNGLLDATVDDCVSTIEDNWGRPEDDEDPEESPWNLKVEARSDNEHDSDGWQAVLGVPYRVSVEGEAESRLIIWKRHGASESEDARAVARKAQRLDEHQEWAEKEAVRIADALGLPEADRAMLAAAARHHDDGKAAKRWQEAFNAPSNWRDGGPYAKTSGPFNRQRLNGYRHEFKSALDAERAGLGGLDRADSRFELALHLIAAHHGRARPGIGIEGCDALPPSAAEQRARAIALRFARLQREWGPWGLAWWEALLRAADQAASRRLDEETA